jgi:hypothetical protein
VYADALCYCDVYFPCVPGPEQLEAAAAGTRSSVNLGFEPSPGSAAALAEARPVSSHVTAGSQVGTGMAETSAVDVAALEARFQQVTRALAAMRSRILATQVGLLGGWYLVADAPHLTQSK